MDDTTRKELRAWLEFYQELGIEGFYRREPTLWNRCQLLRRLGQPRTAVAPPCGARGSAQTRSIIAAPTRGSRVCAAQARCASCSSSRRH